MDQYDADLARALEESLLISYPTHQDAVGSLLDYSSPYISDPSYTPPPSPHRERSREEIEENARKVSRIETANMTIATIRGPMRDAQAKYRELKRQLAMVLEEIDAYNHEYDNCESVLNNHSAIVEHQNIELDRATMMDVYGVDVRTPVSKEEPEKTKEEEKEPEKVKEEEVILPPTLDGVGGTPVRMRFIYPNGTRAEYTTNSHQTIGTIAKYATAMYMRPLRMAGMPGVVLTPSSTLEELGFVSSVVFKFHE